MDFKTYYNKLSDGQKLKFLNAIISKNKDLQLALINFDGAAEIEKDRLSFDRFVKIVNDTMSVYRDKFEGVDTENPDWDNYAPSHSGYIEEWEQYMEASEQEFQVFFDDFKSFSIDLIIQQKVEELTARLIGLYKAVRSAEVPDPVYSFDDINDYLHDEYKRITADLIEKINISALSEPVVLNAFEHFFQYFKGAGDMSALLAFAMEDYLIALTGQTTQPKEILAIMDQAAIDRNHFPRLSLMLLKQAGKTDEWLLSAKIFYKLNDDVALQLLEHYFETDKTEFLKLAEELFGKDNRRWTRPVSGLITPELSRELFIKVFYRLVVNYSNLEDYKKLRPFLDSSLLEKLLKEVRSNKPFQVQVLAAEQRFEEIKTIVQRNPDDWDYSELIRPVLSVYPEFCFDNIKQKVLRTIKNERGRSAYQQIVGWLQLADTIPGYKPQNRILARELYNHKPNLPALKDELRQGGLV